jgi:hypothetical protein
MCGCLLLGLGILAGAGTCQILGHMILDEERFAWSEIPVLGMITMVFGLVGGSLNLRWWWRLTREPDTDPAWPRSRESSRFDRRLLLAAVAITLMLGFSFVKLSSRRSGEHVSREESPIELPAGARDVCYCRGSRGSICLEFSTSEAEFRSWIASNVARREAEAEAAGARLRPIVEPCVVERYGVFPGIDGPDSITIAEGLLYEWAVEDRGARVAFDRGAGRAYYAAHYH